MPTFRYTDEFEYYGDRIEMIKEHVNLIEALRNTKKRIAEHKLINRFELATDSGNLIEETRKGLNATETDEDSELNATKQLEHELTEYEDKYNKAREELDGLQELFPRLNNQTEQEIEKILAQKNTSEEKDPRTIGRQTALRNVQDFVRNLHQVPSVYSKLAAVLNCNFDFYFYVCLIIPTFLIIYSHEGVSEQVRSSFI